MKNELITKEIVDARVQRAFDLAYQDNERDGEVDVDEVVDVIESTHSTTMVKEMLDVIGAKSVREMVLMYLDGRTKTQK